MGCDGGYRIDMDECDGMDRMKWDGCDGRIE
jgi:hypothetical protein